MRRLYARRQQRFVALSRQHLARWIDVAENDSGMQVLGRFVVPLDDREVAAAALRHGIDLQPVSINYHHDIPEHGLLLGYARLNDRETVAAMAALRETFQGFERSLGPERAVSP